jgi:pimeloyl-ACP methyl ester carboxylesterase
MCQAVPKVAIQPDSADAEEKLSTTVSVTSLQVMHVLVPFHHSFARVGYLDLGPSDGPVCLSLHGANGSLFDTADLAAPLTDIGMRFIAPEFPGYGYTKLENESDFDESTQARGELLKSFLTVLNVPRVTTVLSHSLGIAAALHLAANTDTVQSAVSLSGIGVRPHRAIRPYWGAKMLAELLRNSWSRIFASRMLKVAYTFAGFDASASLGLETGVLSVAKIDFDQVAANAARIRQKRLPMLFALTENDRIVEQQVALELAQQCGLDVDSQVTWFDEHEKIVRGPSADNDDDIRTVGYPRALVFARGGHFVQRSHRDIVVKSIVQLVRSILRSEEEFAAKLSSSSFAEVHCSHQVLSG